MGEDGHKKNYDSLESKPQPGRGGKGFYTQCKELHQSYQVGGSPELEEQAPRDRGVN